MMSELGKGELEQMSLTKMKVGGVYSTSSLVESLSAHNREKAWEKNRKERRHDSYEA